MKNLTNYNQNLPSIFDSFFDNFFSDSFWKTPFEQQNLSLDVEETDDGYIVKANLPGIKKEDISIELKGKNLHIFAKQEESKKENGKYYRQERYCGEYQRIISLPSEIKTENINASLNNGVLSINILKAEPSKNKVIKIN